MKTNQLRMINLAPRGIKATCVPTSLCFVTGETYQDIESLIEREQARYRRGGGVVATEFIGDTKNIFGFRFSRIYKERTRDRAKTLREIRSMFPKGTYVVTIPRHMLVMKDGEFFDLCNSHIDNYVMDIWDVKKLS